MKKEGLLSKGLFNKSFMDSRAKGEKVSGKEKILGHLIGPLGLILVINTIAATVEKFFTQQVGAMYGNGNIEMIQKMGARYEVVMTVAKFLTVGAGIFDSWLISRSNSRQGRLRPWHLIFGFVSIAIGFLIFLFSGNTLGNSYWYYFFTLLICYHTVGSSYFYLFRDNIVSLSTRDPKEKEQLTFIRKASWTLISGILIGMLVNSVAILFWLEKDLKGYAKLMIILSIIAIPLLLLEYYYTRNVQYFYIKFMLGGADNGFMYTIYQIITGIPMGIGALLIYPVARKIGIKNMTIGGYSLVLTGSIIGWMFPEQLVPVLIGGFLRNLGWLPNAYIFATLICYAYDHIEYKSGIRLEGLMGAGIVSAVMYLIYAPFAGGFEATILKLGFVDSEGVMASETVKSFITLSFYLFDIILSAAFIILLPFVDVEKKMPEIQYRPN